MPRYKKDAVYHAPMTRLKHKHLSFVIEYVKDFNTRRAAEAAGYEPDYGHSLKQRDDVAEAIDYVLGRRLEASDIDAEWVLMEAVDNVMIAKQQGKISASNTALALVAKHCSVDAFAADKVKIDGADAIVARLKRGRDRLDTSPDVEPDTEVSFL